MNKVLKVIKVIINTLMTVILIVGITFIVLFLIGFEPFVVESGSMEPTIHTGSISFINKHAKYENIKENDVIAFSIPSGKKVTHRVINITDMGMETKGDNNENSDGISTTKDNFIGKNVFSIPKAGYIVKIIQTTRGKIILGTIILVILIAGITMDDKKKSKT